MKREGFWHLASQQMYLLNRLLIGHGSTYIQGRLEDLAPHTYAYITRLRLFLL